jgi:hypothetical protein
MELIRKICVRYPKLGKRILNPSIFGNRKQVEQGTGVAKVIVLRGKYIFNLFNVGGRSG